MLYDSVYDELRSAILRGELSPGAKLTETQIATRLNVSRTPVREALRHLRAERLAIRDGGGLVVASFDARIAGELLIMRILLEPFCVVTSVPYLSAADLDRLDSVRQEMQGARILMTERVRRTELSLRFHDILDSRCPYPRLYDEVRHYREVFMTLWMSSDQIKLDADQVDAHYENIAKLAREVANGVTDPSVIGRQIRARLEIVKSRMERTATEILTALEQ